MRSLRRWVGILGIVMLLLASCARVPAGTAQAASSAPPRTAGSTISRTAASHALPIPAAPTMAPTATGIPASQSLLADPVAVAFATPIRGWLLAGDCSGSGGVCALAATSDGGGSWTVQLRTTLALRLLDAHDAATAWAVGADCGRPARQATATSVGRRALTFAPLAGGGGVQGRPCTGVLLATTDGGATWTVHQTGAILADLQFVDARHGWALATACPAIGSPPCRRPVWATADGGATWRPLPVSAFTPTGLSRVGPSRAWLAGCAPALAMGGCAHPAVLATVDGGQTWQRQLSLPASASAFSASVTFVNPLDGWLLASAAGGCSMDGCWGGLYRTTDGGRRWTQEQPEYRWHMAGAAVEPPGFPGPPVFVSPLVGWIPVAAGAGSGYGGLAETTDGGKTWQRQGARKGWNISGFSAVSARDLWLVGHLRLSNRYAPFLLRSTDGGHTWTRLLPRSTAAATTPASPTPPTGTATPLAGQVSIALGGAGATASRFAPGQTGTVAVGNGEIVAVIHYSASIVSLDDGGFPWKARLTVSPPLWHPLIDNIGRDDVLDLHLFGHATGAFTVRVGGILTNPAVEFRMHVVPNGGPSP